MKSVDMVGRLWLVALIVCFGLAACGGDSERQQKTPLPDKTQQETKVLSGSSMPYLVVRKEDNSFPGRKRMVFTIYSAAETANSMALTVVQAARDLQKSTSADLVEVYLYPSKKLAAIGDTYTAKALFSPDGGGSSGNQGWRWDVCTASSPYTQKEIKIEEGWWDNRNRFRLQNGGTDEPALKEFLSKKLGLPLSEIVLPDHFCDTTVNVN